MRVFAISDIHVDFEENFHWFRNLSCSDYQDDVLILAGDVTHILPLFHKALTSMRKRFLEVLYIPGNHDLWTNGSQVKHSFEKLQLIKNITADCGVRLEPFHFSSLSIIPLYGWYDYSFGYPSQETVSCWSDFIACKWPENYGEKKVTQHFIAMNEPVVNENNTSSIVISFSHFLPRIDIMPSFIPLNKRRLYPLFGTELLEKQIRRLGSRIHVYGHSHVNNCILKNDTLYVNNAFGYPYESAIAARKLKCIFTV